MMNKTLKGYLVTLTFETDENTSPEQDSPGLVTRYGTAVEDLFEMTYWDDDGESVRYVAYPMQAGGWRKAVQDQLEAFKEDPAYPNKDMVKVGLFTAQDVVHVLGIMQAEIYAEVDRLSDYDSGYRNYYQVGVRYDAVYSDGTVEKGKTHWTGGLTFDKGVDWGFLEHCYLVEHAPEGCPPLDWDRIQNNWCTDLSEGDYWMWLALDGTIALGVIEMMDPCDSGIHPYRAAVPDWVWYTPRRMRKELVTTLLAHWNDLEAIYRTEGDTEFMQAKAERCAEQSYQWILNQTNMREKSNG